MGVEIVFSDVPDGCMSVTNISQLEMIDHPMARVPRVCGALKQSM
jgi:hypothetical protein